MTPEDKAYQLTEQFYQIENDSYYFGVNWAIAKASAIIAVDEIIKILVELSNGEFTFIYNVQYWEQVKNEIEKL